MDKLEKMISSGLDTDGKLQLQLDRLKATPTTGLGTGPTEDIVDTAKEATDFIKEEGGFWDFLPGVGQAQGGRIGYGDGKGV